MTKDGKRARSQLLLSCHKVRKKTRTNNHQSNVLQDKKKNTTLGISYTHLLLPVFKLSHVRTKNPVISGETNNKTT